MRRFSLVLSLAALAAVSGGCSIGGHHGMMPPPEVTAVSLNPQDGAKFGTEVGIPFYLPKPMLIVSKNFRNIEETKTGVTESAPIPTGFDDQAKFADVNARTNFAGLQTPISGDGGSKTTSGEPKPGASTAEKSGPYLHSERGAPLSPASTPSDGLSPSTFYTYQIVFVPDMSQKYALKVKGGPGEMRAMMNLVNGWQFTGIGPFYMKDSATAQNILSSGISARLGGQAAADIMNAAADLAKAAAGFTTSGGVDSSHPAVVKMSSTLAALPLGMCPQKIDNFAEIHVYEPHLTPEGRMEWNEIVNLSKSREYLGYECVESVLPIPKAVDPKDPAGKTTSGAPGGLMSAVDSDLGKAALSAVFGPTLNDTRRARPGVLTSGEVGTQLPSSGINQIQVDGGCGKGAREFNVINFGGICNKPDIARPVISNRRVVLPPGEAAPPKDKSLTDSKEKPGAVGGTSSGAVNQVPIPSFNQNITQQVLPPTVLPAPSPPKDPTPKGPGGTSVVPPELILPPVPNPPK